jgi:hypothetical protein
MRGDERINGGPLERLFLVNLAGMLEARGFPLLRAEQPVDQLAAELGNAEAKSDTFWSVRRCGIACDGGVFRRVASGGAAAQTNTSGS